MKFFVRIKESLLLAMVALFMLDQLVSQLVCNALMGATLPSRVPFP